MNTNVERNTKDLVAKVRAKYEKYPSIVTPVLESIHCVSHQFLAALETEGKLDAAQMEDLIDLNQGLLETLGVSHPSLRKVMTIFAQYGEFLFHQMIQKTTIDPFKVYTESSQELVEEVSPLP